MALDSISDDIFLNILQYASPVASARLGLTSKSWKEKILQNNDTETGCNSFTEKLWASFATDRWGNGVSLKTMDGDDDSSEETLMSPWYQYYRHRCSSWKPPTNIAISHLDLIQEHWANDPYKLLTACILCSRTSGGFLIRTVVREFLEKYPTPSAVLAANMSAMAKELQPLGLNRERTMKKFSAGFLKGWTNVTDLHGCGAFAAASFDVFCRGDYKKVLKDKKADRNVRAYASFLKRFYEFPDEFKGRSTSVQDEKPRGSNIKKKRRRSKQRSRVPVRKMTRNR